jgi:hypothetical protein
LGSRDSLVTLKPENMDEAALIAFCKERMAL